MGSFPGKLKFQIYKLWRLQECNLFFYFNISVVILPPSTAAHLKMDNMNQAWKLAYLSYSHSQDSDFWLGGGWHIKTPNLVMASSIPYPTTHQTSGGQDRE